MSEKYYEEQGIDKSLIKKETLKAFLIGTPISELTCLITVLAMWGSIKDPNNNWTGLVPPGFIQVIYLIIALVGVITPIIIVTLAWVYQGKYVNSFRYKLTNSALEIISGVFNHNKVTIPYSRVQNINVVNGVFDRMYKIYTIMIETAGISVSQAQGGNLGRPEGYIPGVKDPHGFEVELRQMLDKYSVLPSGLEEKIFKPQELAFDNFISYIITKMRDKDDLLKTSVKDLREKQNLSIAKLADIVGVKNETIELLEAGRYTPSLSLAYKIARELNCKIEDLFKFE